MKFMSSAIIKYSLSSIKPISLIVPINHKNYRVCMYVYIYIYIYIYRYRYIDVDIDIYI